MDKIDWNHWFRHRTLNDWEVVVLSLGINPMDIDVNSIGGINYIFDEIIPKHRVEYESRVRLLQDFRFKPYNYFEGDDEAGNCFDASDSRLKKVLVKRFLLWLKNEDMGWKLPPELQAYIDSLGKSNKAKLIKTTQQKLSPEEWKPLAEQYAIEIFQSNPDIGIDDTAIKIADIFEKEQILSVRNDLIKWETIKRHLSDWGFNLKRMQVNKK
jgi:hypothetical protein